MAMRIPRKIVPSVRAAALTVRQVAGEFHALWADGVPVRVAGAARDDPSQLLSRGYTPKYKLQLFDTRFFLANVRQNPQLRFFVAYVVQPRPANGRTEIYPRIFYKDNSLVWRSASHFVRQNGELWIGKGDVRCRVEGDEELCTSMESTTDLPLEIQTALETLNRKPRSVRTDEVALDLVLRRADHDRMQAYRDFIEPRRRAAADRRNRIHRGRSIARFRRKNDPASLEITAGFEPDFRGGVIETGVMSSRMYGGALRRFRILSTNREIQYLFFAGPRHVWIIPPQATTTELSSYGVRTVDVVADDDLFVPGFEYHYLDDEQDPPVVFSQIPHGFAGAMHSRDDTRADASRWLDRLPVIREFRKKVLKR
jgi:hypothetical protein